MSLRYATLDKEARKCSGQEHWTGEVLLDPNQTKAALMAELIAMKPDLSPSRAGRLAAKIQAGKYEPSPLQYADPTGETATTNVIRDAA